MADSQEDMHEVESDTIACHDAETEIPLSTPLEIPEHSTTTSNVKYSYRKQQSQITSQVECYPMTHTPRGRALVFTMTTDREGWNSDAEELQRMFQYLDVSVQFFYDFTREQLINELKEFASSQENKEVDCLFVVLAGHGGVVDVQGDEHKNKEYLKTADGERFFVQDEFESIFNNENHEHLIDKPKIFIIQMCRGGFTSLRDTREGTWYIQELTKTFLENAADNQVEELLAQVNKNLEGKESTDKKNATQVGERVSSLKKVLYLFPGLQKKGKPPRKLEKPERVLELSAAANPEVQSAWRVLGLLDQGALLSYGCYPLFKVMRVDSDGQRTGEEYETDHEINALIQMSDRKQVLMTESKGRICKSSLDQLSQVTESWSVDNMTSLWDAAALSQDELVVVDSEKGEVSIYNLDTKKKELKIKGLDFPSSVACFVIGAEKKFAVVEQGKHQVLVYNGTLKQNPDVVIGGREESDEGLNAPICCQFLDSGNLLVSDRDNHRVSEFSTMAPGTLVHHWLTREDGIKHPMSFSFVMPELWVVHSPGQKNVSKFEIFWYDE